jgi:hypothetical protein
MSWWWLVATLSMTGESGRSARRFTPLENHIEWLIGVQAPQETRMVIQAKKQKTNCDECRDTDLYHHTQGEW